MILNFYTPLYFISLDCFNWCFWFLSRRYIAAHIWACPPSEGDDYIFNCHPPDMKIPKQKRLQDWYKKMLDKAIIERVVVDYKVCATMIKLFEYFGTYCFALYL